MSHLILVSSEQYFSEVVKEGLAQRGIETIPHVESYLVSVLQHYLDARNLYEPEFDEAGQKQPQTLAEMYLLAQQIEFSQQQVLLKKLGDKSLYISGFFSDSLQRKVVDVDYYASLGGSAYSLLANTTKEDTKAKVYKTISKRFLDFVDVLTVISNKCMVTTDQNVLRLYDRYLRTGSDLARQKLIEMGVINFEGNSKKLV